ncbi:hypothetical protein FKW77_010354 [Venturia effusa]|uniref:Uncharacterized protein n=1 Tax=Venturia effusa TaxID=50376 RepID=A0A517L6F2_9PEZI|nr:hypothetical protein FKW77_010354 [Venturia effusa]
MSSGQRIIAFEDTENPLPWPEPLSRQLMEGLNLIHDAYPEPVPDYFRRWYNIGSAGEKLPYVSPQMEQLVKTTIKGWVEIVCEEGLTLWWNPSKRLIQYHRPSFLRHKDVVPGTSEIVWAEVKGFGGGVKHYHRVSERIVPPVPVPNWRDITFPMFSAMLADCPKPEDIDPDLADFEAIKAAQFRCGPALDKSRFRILVYSCMDEFATLSINEPSVKVNLLSMVLKIREILENDNQTEKDSNPTKVNGENSITREQNGTRDSQKLASLDVSQGKDDETQTYPGKEVNPKDDDFQGRLLLAEAIRERYLKRGVFEKQERYIEHLWDNRFCPERWPFKLTNVQENSVMQVFRAVGRWIERASTAEGMAWTFCCPSAWETTKEGNRRRFREAGKLVHLLFEKDSIEVRGVDDQAAAYRPIKINVHRGDPLHCPRTFRPTDVGAVKAYFSSPAYQATVRPRGRLFDGSVDGVEDEDYDANVDVIFDKCLLPSWWMLFLSKVDRGWVGKIDNLWSEFTRAEEPADDEED